MTTTITYTTTGRDPELDAGYEKALRRARESGPVTALSHRIKGELRSSGPVADQVDPCQPARIITSAHVAQDHDVLEAILAARHAQPGWARTPVEARNRTLRAMAGQIAARRFELAGIVSAETGKNRTEALAEVQECCDLIEVYCQEIERAAGYRSELRRLTDHEQNTSIFRPYGVFAVIAPFNFPAALPWNMVLGAIVTGNAAVLKPAEQAPWSGALVGEIAQASGLPDGVLNVIHGDARVGELLVGGPIDGVAFTGSATVGHAIARRLHQHGPLRPALLEMGGKNPAIVTGTADLDCAAEGIVRAAFGFSGQKCSACSRVIATRDVHDELVERIARLTSALVVGDPADPASDLGPMIDAESVARYERACSEARRDGVIVTGGERLHQPGYYVAPTVVSGLARGHRLTRDELFLPFVTVTAASDLTDALAEANAVDYGLTAGIFTESAEEQRAFLDTVMAGVLYVNRREGATTGAWPGVQSFCGWKLSGGSGKGALGPHYLQQFLREQTHTIMNGAAS